MSREEPEYGEAIDKGWAALNTLCDCKVDVSTVYFVQRYDLTYLQGIQAQDLDSPESFSNDRKEWT